MFSNRLAIPLRAGSDLPRRDLADTKAEQNLKAWGHIWGNFASWSLWRFLFHERLIVFVSSLRLALNRDSGCHRHLVVCLRAGLAIRLRLSRC